MYELWGSPLLRLLWKSLNFLRVAFDKFVLKEHAVLCVDGPVAVRRVVVVI